MSTTEEIGKILRMIEVAESSLKTARSLLSELAPGANLGHKVHAEEASAYESGENQVVEGTFDGQNMIGPNEKTYPVPANYASKSKLLEGDRLKLTILPNGTFLYKQISPVDREFIRGTLVKEDGQFKVLANGKSYKVLLASVTYYKGSVGDDVTLIIPKDRETLWGTIETVIPAVGSNYNAVESF
jgi:hypothetical protein